MKMVTQYNEGDLVSFGKYLLSDVRTERIINHPNAAQMLPAKERLKEVHHADVSNWLDSKSEKALVKRVQSMCEESLPPELMDKWEEIQDCLSGTRKNLKD